MELAFVLAGGQNAFFRELAEALMDELTALGVRSSLHLDSFPEQRRGRVNLLLPPHEFFALRGHELPPEAAPLERTVLVCGEQPGGPFFRRNLELAARAGALFDINPGSVAEMGIRGAPARLLPLGWTRRWDGAPFDGPREVDVCFLGCHSGRRVRALGSYAPLLARRRCELVISDNSRPNSTSSGSFLAGESKLALLRRSKVLLNVHHDELPYFEWLRVVEAVLSGAVLVTEHSTNYEPLVPGRHFAPARVESLGLVAEALLDDEERLARMRAEAYAALRARPLSQAAALLAEAAEEVDRRAPVGAVAAAASPAALQRSSAPDWLDRGPPEPPDVTKSPDASAIRRAVKDLKIELMDVRRELDGIARSNGAMPRAVDVQARTPSWWSSHPRVSVVLTSYCYEQLLLRALDSVAASSFDSLELVIVDDASRDSSLDLARGWLREHPQIPAVLVTHSVNRGLGHARNTGIDFARGELVFILDADNALYPHGIERLVEALDGDPDADFAYGILEQFTPEGTLGLMGLRGWEPEQLRANNYIDAMALVRARTLRELRGYTTHPRLHGYEDWDLWCGIAERGGYGVRVREIVARYRVAEHSMSRSTSALSATDAISVLSERHPELMAGVTLPL